MAQVTITLNGRAYRLNCGPGEEARLNELARDLNLRLERLAIDFGQHGSERLLVMAALLLTDELMELESRLGSTGSDRRSEIEDTDTDASVPDGAAANPIETAGAIGTDEPGAHAAPAAESAPESDATHQTAPRISFEARLAEARAGRPSVNPPKSGAA